MNLPNKAMTEKRSETIVRYAEILSLIMKGWTDEERMEFISHIRSDFCLYCGLDVPQNTCHCWNDE